MKNFYLLLIIAIIHSQFSCNSVETKRNSIKDKAINSGVSDSISDQIFTTNWKTITKDFMTLCP